MISTSFEGLKQYLFVIKQISYKDHKRKTDETNLGVVWNVLNPLLYMVILSTYYQNVISHDIENFPIFVFTGITMMNFYSTATKGAMHSLVGNKSLLIRSQIPMRTFILQKVLMAFREMLFSCVALIPIMIYFRIHLSWRVVQLLPIMLLTIAVIIGMGTILAITYVFFADIDYLYSVFMTMMFFVSGVFMPTSKLPGRLQGLATYNPIFLSIYLSRNALVYNLPSHWTAWVKLSIWAVGLGFIAYLMAKKTRNSLIGRM